MILLITGGLGHIGSYVIPKLINEKNINKIYLLDNLSNQRFNVLFELKDKKISFIYGDLSNKKILKNLPKSDIVIHLASITNAEKSFENEKEVNENNFGSFKNIVEYCNKYKSRLIHISSTSVYGPQKNLVDESQKKYFQEVLTQK